MLLTKTVQITARADGSKTTAELLVCPDCDGSTFLCYKPTDVQHLHFQCSRCGQTFCDGCTK